MTNFAKDARKMYDHLITELESIENELKPLTKYLEAVGELPKRRRGRRKKNT